MLGMLAFGPAVFAVVTAAIMLIVFRKKDPGKMAVIFSCIAFVFGITHIVCEFFPFEYTGPDGIDYIGQAIVWGLMVQSILYGTLAAYISFAVVATVSAVRTLRKGRRAKGTVSLILAWICGFVICCLVVTNIVRVVNHKRNIRVEVREVTAAVDSDGDPAAVILYEIYNDTRTEITYHSSIYEEVTQNGRSLSHAIVKGPEELKDSDIKAVAPGGSRLVRKTYKLKEPGAKVEIVLRTYGGDYTYLTGKYTPK